MAYRYAKRQKRTDVPNAKAEATAAPKIGGGVPNSALLASMGYHDGGGSSDLQAAMEQKRRSIVGFDREASEAEADKLSEGLRARTPEAVKREMGQRLGADFSGVRFHEDAQSAAKAENMGADAWAQGGDVYFGARGFDPSVAAHELVHTVQQGAAGPVAAMSPVAQSAPMGAVQMKKTKAQKQAEKDADRLFKIQMGRLGERGYFGAGAFGNHIHRNVVSEKDAAWYNKMMGSRDASSPELVAELKRRRALAAKELMDYRKSIPGYGKEGQADKRQGNRAAMLTDQGRAFTAYERLDGVFQTTDRDRAKELYEGNLTPEQIEEAEENIRGAKDVDTGAERWLRDENSDSQDERWKERAAYVYQNFDEYQKNQEIARQNKNISSGWVDIEDDEMKEIANAFQDANGGNLGGLGGGLMKSNAIRLKKKKK